MSGRPVHVVVVGFGAPEALDACLTALGSAYPVTLVDNSSSPAVCAVAAAHGCAYDDPGTNLGFGRAVNRALVRLLEGDPVDVLLLNPDARLAGNDVGRLAAELRASASTGALSPRVVDEKGRAQRALWPFPSPARAWGEALGLGRLPARRSFAIGAVLLLRWEALREVGLFDDRFFLYAEETDWQRRAWARGWRPAVSAGVTATHTGGGTSTDPARREALFHAAQETYVRKWFGPAGWQAYRAAAWFGARGRSLVLGEPRRSEAAARAHLYLQGPRRIAGLDR